MHSREEVSILFSGGSDSTLVAALMCEKFEKVHLLTFYHSGIPEAERSKVNARRLENRFGKNRVVHRLMNVEQIFQNLYYATYVRDLRKYRLFLVATICNACQLAMHTATILYNLNNGISLTRDGYKREKGHIYAFMSEEGIKHLRTFYRKYQINYDNPVYDMPRTDWVLFDMGITPRRDVKFPHEPYEHATQHLCPHGILTNAYMIGYHFPLYHRVPHKWMEYHREKIAVAEKYIQFYLREKRC